MRRKCRDDGGFFRCRGRPVGGHENTANTAAITPQPEDHRLVVWVGGTFEPGSRLDDRPSGLDQVVARVTTQLPVGGHTEVRPIAAAPQALDLSDHGWSRHTKAR